jgi:A/G-specific adenine glycosylase
MLQQTQVSRVVEYYTRFLEAFPTIEDVAAAPLGQILRLWEGLGYYSRARSLHAACELLAERHGGRFPETYAEAVALPGVGDYTAGAVLSIAFGHRLPAIDANAKRVLCRIFLDPGDTADSRCRIRAFGEAAVPEDRPGDYNQALMELGSLICRPLQPKCGDCCLSDVCGAWETKDQHSYPRRRRQEVKTSRAVLGLVRRRGRVLIAQRPAQGVWGGLWEFPNFEVPPGADAPGVLQKGLLDSFGLACTLHEDLGALNYGIMNRRVRLHICSCSFRKGRTVASAHVQARWLTSSEIGAYPLPAPHRRVAERHLAAVPGA